jgi:hypothetical protein
MTSLNYTLHAVIKNEQIVGDNFYLERLKLNTTIRTPKL